MLLASQDIQNKPPASSLVKQPMINLWRTPRKEEKYSKLLSAYSPPSACYGLLFKHTASVNKIKRGRDRRQKLCQSKEFGQHLS